MSDSGGTMATTQFFVELLVIGFGTLAWVFLLGATLFGYDPRNLGGSVSSITTLLPVLTFAYLLGIITDRVADWLFDRQDKKHFNLVYRGKFESYHHDRRTLVHYGSALWAHLEYGRSRLRICRGWALNSACLVVSFNLWVFLSPNAPDWAYWKISAGNLAGLVLMLLCILAWQRLNTKEYEKIQRQAEWLRKQLRLAGH